MKAQTMQVFVVLLALVASGCSLVVGSRTECITEDDWCPEGSRCVNGECQDVAADGDADTDADVDGDGDADTDTERECDAIDDTRCDDGNPCTDDSCDVDEGVCVNANASDDTSCEGTFFCRDGETCDGDGACDETSGTPHCADDGNPCVTITCFEEEAREPVLDI